VLAGRLYFTTYNPGDGPVASETVVDGTRQCKVDLGNAKLYVVDIYSGHPTVSGPGTTSATDRAIDIGSQPATGSVPVITQNDSGESVLESTHQAGTQFPPDPASSELSFYPSYWFQE